jgi:putative FmdB family regulatory protein
MPSYEYTCKTCNDSLVISRSFSEEDPGYFCSTCESKMVRVYASNNIGIIFNGSGFYSKDK